MPLREVPTLIPSTYRVTGYDGRPRRHTFTAKDAQEAADTLNKQLKAGLRIPVCLMHDPDAEPAYLSHKDPEYVSQWRAFNGYMGDAKQAVVKNGCVHVIADIPDEEDAKKFDKIGTVSPSLVRDWVDERGVKWKGWNVLHIGLTPKPVQRDLPRARAYPAKSRPDAIWFSFPLTGSKQMADEKEDMMPGEGLSDDTMNRIVDAMKKLGVHIVGTPTNDAELLIALESAIETKNGGGSEGGEMDTDEPVDLGDDMGMGTEAVPPAFLSHWLPKMAEVEDDKRRKDIADLFSNSQITGPTRDMLVGLMDKVNLSHNPAKHFDAKGRLKPLEIDSLIAAYKLLPKGQFRKDKTNLGHTVPVAPVDRKPATETDARLEAANEVRAHLKASN